MNHYKFTDDEHESESNLEHTWFRQLSSTEGRWLSPDPYSGSMDLTNPQSLNRYAYVLNGPTNYSDPYGLYCSGATHDEIHDTPCNPFNFGGGGGGGSFAGYGVFGLLGTPVLGAGNGLYGYLRIPIMSNPGAGVGEISSINELLPVYGPELFPTYLTAFDLIGGSLGSLWLEGSGAGGGQIAASNGTLQKPANHCLRNAVESALLHGSVDALAMVPVLGEASDAIALGAGLASNDYKDATGTSITYVGGVISIVNKPATLKAIGKFSTRLAEGIPILGEVVGAGALIYDGISAFREYQACMAGGG